MRGESFLLNSLSKKKIRTRIPPMLGPYYLTFLWSIAPFLELRASIPLGHLRFGLSIYEATAISIVGSILTAAVLLLLLPTIVRLAERFIPAFHRFMLKIFEKTRTRHSKKIAVIGEIALITFVAIPLPGSGAWTGVLISYLFGIPYKKALLFVGTGVLISGIIVAILTLFGQGLWEIFTERVV